MTCNISLFVLGLSVKQLANPGIPVELINPTAWVNEGALDSVLFGDGVISFNSLADGTVVDQVLPVEVQNVNGAYVVSVTVSSITTGTLLFYNSSVTTPGVYTTPIDNPGSTFQFLSNLSNAVITNVSLKRLSDAQLGPELITNGGFAGGTGWVSTPDGGSGDPWSFSGGAARCTDSNNGGQLTNTGATVTANSLYKLVFGISNLSSGIINLYVKDGPASFQSFNGADYATNGLKTVYAVPSYSGDFSLYDSYGIFDIDNVSLRKYVLT